MTLDLFDALEPTEQRQEQLASGAFVLRAFALPCVPQLLPALALIEHASPFRHLVTPGGFRMSVAMTCCGALGWTSDRRGYRYSAIDPDNGRHWPPMPPSFLQLAQSAAAKAGYDNFMPEACLINRYAPGTRLTLHQDKDELDYEAPIVSVSLGVPAMFLFGGHERSDKAARVPLFHGDVVVWGGPDRLRFHGILPLKEAEHPLLGRQRINLTFRKVA
ncbi:DNA oxidative demethylase AlkB [Collimonas pratensis]|uniref:DNA oxidative demethylase AlkB n=1 Tax=Collimonas pratensis TaxID=279113 RepID=UPI00143D8817|nr:DNA oxidative demethylase AlkB [Collimonas pratensis]NKI68168.1 DNA oxidative demethylase AlkB [Collimonas pratensis]